MSRKLIFLLTGSVWIGASIVYNDPTYIKMIAGGGISFLIHWSTNK